MWGINLQIKEAFPNRIDTKKTTSIHIIVKMLISKETEKL